MEWICFDVIFMCTAHLKASYNYHRFAFAIISELFRKYFLMSVNTCYQSLLNLLHNPFVGSCNEMSLQCCLNGIQL